MSDIARVLIVDDDPGTRETISDVLGVKGYAVHTAPDGRAGLDAIGREQIDVAILDLKLPDVDGLELLDRIKEASPTTEVIFVTAYASLPTAIEAMNGAAFSYLTKPFDMDYLLATIHKAREKQALVRALRDSEERYRLVTEHIQDAVFLVDLEGRFTFGNRRLEELTGYRLEEVLGQSIFLVLTPEGVQAASARLDALRAGQDRPFFYETEIVRKDGARIWAEVSSTSVVENGKLFARLHVARDITERRRNEQALATAAARLSLLHEIDRSIIAAETPETMAAAVLPRLRDLLGVPRAIVNLFDLGAGEVEWLAGAGRRRVRLGPGVRYSLRLAGDVEALRKGEPQRIDIDSLPPSPEVDALRASGVQSYMVVPMIATGELIGSVSFGGLSSELAPEQMSVAQEVAAQLAIAIAQARLRERVTKAERQYRQIVENSVEGIYRSTRAGRLLLVNPAMARIYGYDSPADMLASVTDIERQMYVDPEERQAMLRLLDEHGAVSRFECRGKRKDGTVIWVSQSPREVRDDRNEILYCDGVLEDITDRKQLQQELLHAQRMEGVGQLAGGIAHDFNNLLTVISGRSQLGLDRLPPEDPLRRDLDLIYKTATRAATLTRQLLAFSRKQVLQPKVIDVIALMQGATSLLKRLIGEDIELTFVPAADTGRIWADPGQIEQVIVNLAVNARDAMPRGGRLTIETGNLTLGTDYAARHVNVAPGRYVVLAVTDSGVGMPPEVRARIFEPFFTTKDPGKGTGLGLATVYGIVKQTGGHIRVYSEPGAGTTFRIYLPRTDAAHAATITPRERALPRGQETVLLVEDEPEVRSLAREILERLGYTVLEAASPADALLVAQQHVGIIDLLLTDVIMPGMSGRALAERITTERREAKVLFMSGYTDDAIVRHGVLEAGIQFIEKPFTHDAFAFKVRHVLDQPS